MASIKPGTLCLIVQSGNTRPEFVGLSATVLAHLGPCQCGGAHCGGVDLYDVTLARTEGTYLADRRALRPILPPGIDTTEATDRPVTTPAGVPA